MLFTRTFSPPGPAGNAPWNGAPLEGVYRSVGEDSPQRQPALGVRFTAGDEDPTYHPLRFRNNDGGMRLIIEPRHETSVRPPPITGLEHADSEGAAPRFNGVSVPQRHNDVGRTPGHTEQQRTVSPHRPVHRDERPLLLAVALLVL